jgi:hypothetical protein
MHSYFPADIPISAPEQSALSPEDQRFLLFIPWNDAYLQFVPPEYRAFYTEILPLLSVRTTDVHTAICLQYLDEFIHQAEQQGQTVNRNVVAYALMLHDIGWSKLSENEIAASLGVKGLALNESALAPKEKHAILSEEIAREILTSKQAELQLSTAEIELICQAVRYHDQPEKVAGLGKSMPIEIQLLVDLDHLWSFTHFNFWQDTLRKKIDPKEYLANLKSDLDKYFVTEIGKTKARELLSEREKEVAYI